MGTVKKSANLIIFSKTHNISSNKNNSETYQLDTTSTSNQCYFSHILSRVLHVIQCRYTNTRNDSISIKMSHSAFQIESHDKKDVCQRRRRGISS